MKIVARQLNKEYTALKKLGIFNSSKEQVVALSDFNLEIDKPMILGLVGPNGAGKTTFIKLCLGLITPTDGSIQVMGFDPNRRNYGFLRQVGLASGQIQNLNPHLSALDALLLVGLQYGMEENTVRQRIADLTSKFELGHKLENMVRDLSLGERMKLEIIASIVHSPRFLFMDEPTLGLDFQSRNYLYDMIKSLNRDHGVGILITSHHLHDITSLCDRLAIINEGRKVFEGTIQEVLAAETQEKYMRSLVAEMEKYA